MMKKINEKELNRVNGGGFLGLLGDDNPPHKFNIGDQVICYDCKEVHNRFQTGVITNMMLGFDGWYYNVDFILQINGQVYASALCPEYLLESLT